MMVVPAATPITAPDAETVATDVVPLVHDTPDVVASDTNVLPPAQTVSVPDIGTGFAFTVMRKVLKQLLPSE